MLEKAVMMIFASLGTLFHLIFILTFLIDDQFCNHNYTFWLNIILNDLVTTTGAFVYFQESPTTAVLTNTSILIGWQAVACQPIQTLAQWSTYNTNIFFMMEFAYLYYRLSKWNREECREQDHFKFQVKLLSVLVIMINFGFAFIGVHFKLDQDFCDRSQNGHSTFRTITRMLFYVIPFIITFYYFTQTKNLVDKRCQNARYTPIAIYKNHKNLTCVHYACYMLFVLFWFPYIFVEINQKHVPDSVWYFVILLGLFRTNLTSIIYIIGFKTLRQSVFKIFSRIFCFDTTTTKVSSRTANYYPGRNEFQAYDQGHQGHKVEMCLVHGVRYKRNVQNRLQRNDAQKGIRRIKVQNALTLKLREPVPMRDNIEHRSVRTLVVPDPQSRISQTHSQIETSYV